MSTVEINRITSVTNQQTAPASTTTTSESMENQQAEPAMARPVGTNLLVPTQMVHIKHIEANPWQPRIEFNRQDLIELAESIRANGLLQPVVVRQVGASADGIEPAHYQIIAGERRWRAFRHLAYGYLEEFADPELEGRVGAKKIVKQVGVQDRATGKTTTVTKETYLVKGEADPSFFEIPVQVRPNVSDEMMMRLALEENAKRVNVSALEEARAYEKIMHDLGVTQEGLARRFDLKQPTVANRMRLLKLPQESHKHMLNGKIGQKAGILLLKWQNQHKVGSALLGKIADALADEKIRLSELETDYRFYQVVAEKVPDVINIGNKHPKFKPEEHCADCVFFGGDLSQRWSGSWICANPSHFNRLQREAQAAEKALDNKNAAQVVESYGTDVIRTPTGKPLQLKPEKDSDGVNILDVELIQKNLGWQGYKSVVPNKAPFDTDQCFKCEFFGRINYNPLDQDTDKSYTCTNPDHYQKLQTEASNQKKAAQVKVAIELSETFHKDYALPVLLSSPLASGQPNLDAPTARFIAIMLMSSIGIESHHVPRIKKWLRDLNLNETLEQLRTEDYRANRWIDDEIHRINEEQAKGTGGQPDFTSVVLKAFSLYMFQKIVRSGSFYWNTGLDVVTTLYLDQVLGLSLTPSDTGAVASSGLDIELEEDLDEDLDDSEAYYDEDEEDEAEEEAVNDAAYTANVAHYEKVAN